MMSKLIDIAQFLGATMDNEQASQIVINQAMSISDSAFAEDAIGWCSDANIALLEQLKTGNVIVSQSSFEVLKEKDLPINLLPVSHPRRAFMHVLQEFFVEKVSFGNIHASAVIEEGVQMDINTVSIGANVLIEKGSIIGNNVSIGANTVVKSKTVVGNNCSIGSNCTIGGVGFGYEMDEDGNYELMPHIGNVLLHNNVEIGNNVCIDRAVMGSTTLHENVKVDNLVHIAHGVVIGKNSLIIANAMVAGSVTIGENVWVSPSSSIRQKLHIGDKSLVGLGSVVVKNVQDETVVAGNPAKVFEKK